MPQAVTFFVSDVIGIAIEMKYHAFKFLPVMGQRHITKPILKVMLITNTFGSLS